ncbi:MAG TPA: DUF3618 domain-containing protein [Acidimicrobiales bacterium]|nr:DUF3618 domain-containing protein [Acidimicrobiales bacterium]
MTDPVTARSGEQPETVEEARAQIDLTREQLGETVQALAEKADVKAQLRRKVDETRARVAEKASSLQSSIAEGSPKGTDPTATWKQTVDKLAAATRSNPPAALAGALCVGLLLGRLTKRKRA